MGIGTSVRSIEIKIGHLKNSKLPSYVRRGMLHEMVDIAIAVNTHDVWLMVGQEFVRLCDKRELSTQISDRFVDAAPDQVFLALGTDISTYQYFRSWKFRVDRAIIAAKRR